MYKYFVNENVFIVYCLFAMTKTDLGHLNYLFISSFRLLTIWLYHYFKFLFWLPLYHYELLQTWKRDYKLI